MDVLDGFEVTEKPRMCKRSKWNTEETIMAFVDTGNECMAKRFDDKGVMNKMYSAFTQFLNRHDEYPVIALRRENTLMLMRSDL